jgi:hypothetical protein
MSALQVVFAISLLVWSSRADTVDTCAYLDNFDLSAALNSELSITLIPDSDGKLKRCLCVSGISGTSPFDVTVSVHYCSLSFKILSTKIHLLLKPLA